MNAVAHALIRAYPAALRLYPRQYREEYGDEMEAVFVETCLDAAAASPRGVWVLGLRELRDLPANLIREHWSELWRHRMQNHPGSPEPLPKSILRGGLGFGLGFAFIFLAYCLLDALLNPGKTIGTPGTVWLHLLIHPNALGSALGTAYLAWGSGRRRVWLSALSGFCGYELVLLVGSHAFLPHLTHDYLIARIYQALFMGAVGVLVGGGLGLAQRGWKQAGWSALAGAVGYNLGWLICDLAGVNIILRSPYGDNITNLVIGSLWYYAYYLIPGVVLGIVIGICLGAAAAIKGRQSFAAVV